MHGCGCCSMQCERKDTCALYHGNILNQAVVVVENYYNYGCGSINVDKSEVLWWCGPHGDWGMYQPLEV